MYDTMHFVPLPSSVSILSSVKSLRYLWASDYLKMETYDCVQRTAISRLGDKSKSGFLLQTKLLDVTQSLQLRHIAFALVTFIVTLAYSFKTQF